MVHAYIMRVMFCVFCMSVHWRSPPPQPRPLLTDFGSFGQFRGQHLVPRPQIAQVPVFSCEKALHIKNNKNRRPRSKLPPPPPTRYRQQYFYFYFVLQVSFKDTLYFLLKYVLPPVLFTLKLVFHFNRIVTYVSFVSKSLVPLQWSGNKEIRYASLRYG